jgi:CBS domain-containing protein
VRDYLDTRHKMLSLSGPTKSGKTVLLKTVLPPATWVSGGSVKTGDDFWEAVVDRQGLYTNEAAETTSGQSDEISDAVRGGGALPGRIAHIEGEHKDATAAARGKRHTLARERSPMRVALAEFRKFPDAIVVIDDFHYIPADAQLDVVRALKEPVFEGVAVILASVPHRAFDAVRMEKEMTGRVEQLRIEFWAPEELHGIAKQGFDALNVEVSADIVGRLAAESFSSPHLMQEFCLQLCLANGVRETQEQRDTLDGPDDWESFFRRVAESASKSEFDLLSRGPRQRSDRKERILKDGRTTDIYGAVLAAIAATGPLTELPYTELRASLRNVMESEPPQRHEVTRILDEMTKIAREKIEGEPVVDYDEQLETLHISDPFFAYFLRWGLPIENR